MSFLRRSTARPDVPSHLTRFAELVRRRPEDISLVEATLEIARQEYPDLDTACYVKRIDDLAAAAAAHDPGPGAPVRERLQALNRVLFEDAGLCGNARASGDDPRDSYINDVLERRTGLPVILSVIYLEMGGRLGIGMAGVGLPGHFIVRLLGEDPALFVDPYHGGTVMTKEGCGKLLQRVSKGELELQPEYLKPVSPHRILDRILHNLKAVYTQDQDYRRARKVVDQILILRPDDPEEVRDRGILAYRCLLFEQAVADLEHYVELAPKAKDTAAVRTQLQSLRRLVGLMN